MERFYDTKREIQKLPTIKFNDNREFTHEFVFYSFFRSKKIDRDMKKALYLITVKTPFKIVISSDKNEKEIDIEKIFEKDKKSTLIKERDQYQEALFDINGVKYSADSTNLYQALKANGTIIYLNSH